MKELRGATAMIGASTRGIGVVGPDVNVMELAGEAALKAADNAGVELSEVDGVFGAIAERLFFPNDLAEYLGLNPSFCDGTQIGGSSLEAHCISAAMALNAGLCNVALICYASTVRSQKGPWPISREPSLHIDPYQTSTITSYAMAAARHMHDYGTTREQLASVATSARAWATKNPEAYKRDPLTITDVIEAKPVASPFTIADCCLVTDGAGAIIMTRADRAKDARNGAIYFLGGGIGLSHTSISQMKDLTISAASISSPRAYAMAGLRAKDIDLLQLYDAFTINVIMFLEDLGFCEKGAGGAFVESGAIAPGGTLPVNTNGGGLSCVHPGMYGMFELVEAFRQMTGAAGERQVEKARTAICHGNGGIFSSQVTTIWGDETTV